MNIVTTSDKNYLPRGLVLYHSLMHHDTDFKLFWLCIDERTYRELSKLNYKNIIPINRESLSVWKKYDLKKVPSDIYKMTPLFTKYIQDNFGGEVLYIDSDICFYKSYKFVLEDVKSIGIHEHRIPSYKNVGKYNVGVVYFDNETGQKALDLWVDCVMNSPEEYKEYSTCHDQKYLELFPLKWPDETGIIDCGHAASWNWKWQGSHGDQVVWNGKPQDIVFVHYSHFNYDIKEGWYKTHLNNPPEWRPEANPLARLYYDGYFKRIKRAHEILDS